MAKVTVYRVQLYDVAKDEPVLSRRMVTREGAQILNGTIIEGSGIEIDEARLENWNQWTEVDYDPDRRTGFPRDVRV